MGMGEKISAPFRLLWYGVLLMAFGCFLIYSLLSRNTPEGVATWQLVPSPELGLSSAGGGSPGRA